MYKYMVAPTAFDGTFEGSAVFPSIRRPDYVWATDETDTALVWAETVMIDGDPVDVIAVQEYNGTETYEFVILGVGSFPENVDELNDVIGAADDYEIISF